MNERTDNHAMPNVVRSPIRSLLPAKPLLRYARQPPTKERKKSSPLPGISAPRQKASKPLKRNERTSPAASSSPQSLLQSAFRTHPTRHQPVERACISLAVFRLRFHAQPGEPPHSSWSRKAQAAEPASQCLKRRTQLAEPCRHHA